MLRQLDLGERLRQLKQSSQTKLGGNRPEKILDGRSTDGGQHLPLVVIRVEQICPRQ
jgi:hypothetical protein